MKKYYPVGLLIYSETKKSRDFIYPLFQPCYFSVYATPPTLLLAQLAQFEHDMSVTSGQSGVVVAASFSTRFSSLRSSYDGSHISSLATDDAELYAPGDQNDRDRAESSVSEDRAVDGRLAHAADLERQHISG